MVAVFDTAFHAGMPEHAFRYAIPHELAVKHGIRRYGFHGLAYRSVLARYAELVGTPIDRATLVALHLGNGCSAAAIKNGRSVDTSMGFTPLEGLVMGTRSGDVDPALVGHLARTEKVPVQQVERWLNESAGLLGLSGRSRDMRDLLAREQDDPRARLAVDVFCYRARKYLGAYLAVLGGADAVVFSGGIGEHASEVRGRICAGMEWTGLVAGSGAQCRRPGRRGPAQPRGRPLARLRDPGRRGAGDRTGHDGLARTDRQPPLTPRQPRRCEGHSIPPFGNCDAIVPVGRRRPTAPGFSDSPESVCRLVRGVSGGPPPGTRLARSDRR